MYETEEAMSSFLIPCQQLGSFTLHNVSVDVQEQLFHRLAIPKDCTIHIMIDSGDNVDEALHPCVLLSRHPRFTHLRCFDTGFTVADERDDKLQTSVVEVNCQWDRDSRPDVSSWGALGLSHVTAVTLSVEIQRRPFQDRRCVRLMWGTLSPLLPGIQVLTFEFNLHLLKELIRVHSLPSLTRFHIWSVMLEAPVAVGGSGETNLDVLLKWLSHRRTVYYVAPIRTIELEKCGFQSEDTLERLRTEGRVVVVVKDRRRGE